MNIFYKKKYENTLINTFDRYFEGNQKEIQTHTIKVSANSYKMFQKPTVEYIEHYRNIYSTPDNFIKRRVDYGRMKVIDEKLRKESERLKTLSSFPKNLEKLSKPIARSGFYSIANNMEPDKVKCIFCQGILNSWKKSDNPEKEHKKAFPTCPFLLNLNVGNEPFVEPASKNLTIDPDLENVVDQEIPYVVIKPDENLILSDNLEYDIERREHSFADFDHLKHFALQGLFVVKKDDLQFLKCHKCHKQIELLNDANKLPESVFHNPDCYYRQSLITDKNKNSEDFQVLDNMKDKSRCIIEYSITTDEIEARLDSRITNQIENLQINRSKVKEMIARKLKSTGRDYESTFELLMDMKNYVRNQDMECDPNPFEFILPNNVCVVCLDQPVEVVFLPCGHLKTCKSCSNMLSNCPVCRQVIEKRVWGIRLGSKL